MNIRILAVTAFFGIGTFIWHSLRIPQPAVKLSILKNRTLALTNVFTFVLGIGLFTSVYVFPVMVQRINGFTALETGLSVLYPTLFALIMFPMMGRAMAAGFPATPFVFVGALLFASFGIYGGTMNADANRWDFFYVLILRTGAMSMMQLPLITQAVMGLPPAQYPPAIALNNMMRQLGGAFGIAISNNFIASHYAQHRADLIAHVSATNPAAVERLNLLKNGMIAKTGDAATAADQALTMMSRMVDKQAYLLSYLDTFRMLSYFFIGLLPLVFLIRRPKGSNPAAAKEAMSDAH